jgi:hypothetical protein
MTDPAFLEQIAGIAADALHAQNRGKAGPPADAETSES